MDKSLILNDIKKHLGIVSNKDFAAFLGIKPTTLSMWYSRNMYDIDLLFKKCEFLNPEWLLTGKGKMLKKVTSQNMVNEPTEEYIPLIPIEAMAGKGNGSFQIQKKDIIDGYLIPEFSERGVEYIIRVSGSSMYPKYSSGDLLGCKTIKDLTFFQWGKVYVLDTDQGPMVKRLYPVESSCDMLECRSDNKDYPPFPINKESIYKIAIVIGVLRLE